MGSPLVEFCSQEEFVALGRGLKKNGVAVDVVLFGEIELSRPLLAAFVEAVNSNDNSHLLVVEVPQGIREAIASSEILRSGTSSIDTDMGIDAEADPELAEAIRLSLQEQVRHSPAQEPSQSAPAADQQDSIQEDVDDAEEQDEELMQAIAMSLEGTNSSTPQTNQDQSSNSGK